jgi:ATP-dependent Clp protease ATP-binding subunit ClpC
VLAEAGVRPPDVDERVAADAGRARDAGGAGRDGAASAGEPSYTGGVAAAAGDAEAEALNLGHSYVGTEHLLLALFRDARGPAAEILARLGLTHDTATASILRRLTPPQR